MKPNFRSALVALPVLALLLLVGPGRATGAAAAPSSIPGQRVELVAEPVDHFTQVGVRKQPSLQSGDGNVATATFAVTYTGFGPYPGAQAAFQYAVDQWAQLITSNVVIHINANFSALGANILGSAGPTTLYRDFSGATQANTWYAVALAEALTGSELNGASLSDIDASFSSSFSNWYFGTDGNTPAGKYDFVTVVMHEIGHGLGMVGGFNYSAGTGSWGAGTGWGGRPAIYDRFLVNGSNQVLISSFANSSAALGSQLVSNNLYFSGTNANAGNGGSKAKVYAPATWTTGSSLYHLDESTYPAGNANSLMTYAIGSAEAIHDPGPVGRGIFQDMGWTVASGGGGGGGGGSTATKLAFTIWPGNSVAGNSFATQPKVAVQDASSNTLTSQPPTAVTLAVASGPGTLSGCSQNPVNTVNGVATFSGCKLTVAGDYTLLATSTGLTSATSGLFSIAAAAASKLAFTTQPSNGNAGVALGTQPAVTVRDAYNNTVTSPNKSVTLSLTSGPGVLSCTTNPLTSASGVASFANCAVSAGGNYTMQATASGLASATSNSFTISAQQYAVSWGSHNTPTSTTTGASFIVNVTFTNAGSRTWLKATAAMDTFRYRWRSGTCALPGAYVVPMGLTTNLPADVASGGTVAGLLPKIVAPAAPGTYCLVYDLYEAGLGWFSAQGAATLNTTVTVSGSLATYGVSWARHNTPKVMTASANYNVNLTLVNTGSLLWSKAGTNPMVVQYRWQSGTCASNGAQVGSGGPVTLKADTAMNRLISGQVVNVVAPGSAGSYCLVYDLEQTGITLFSAQGAAVLKVNVTVN